MEARAFRLVDLATNLAGNTHHEAAGRNLRAFGNERACRDHGAFADSRAVEHDGPDTDQAVILDSATVQNDRVSDGDAVADVEREFTVVDMEDGVVLDVAIVTDADGVDIAAQGSVAPDAGTLADFHIADDLGAGVKISGGSNAGQCAAVGANHVWEFLS